MSGLSGRTLRNVLVKLTPIGSSNPSPDLYRTKLKFRQTADRVRLLVVLQKHKFRRELADSELCTTWRTGFPHLLAPFYRLETSCTAPAEIGLRNGYEPSVPTAIVVDRPRKGRRPFPPRLVPREKIRTTVNLFCVSGNLQIRPCPFLL
jgi:tRNA/tmRNA/rRNA uracil-C5-methylase (TrmA/RlmC/RlmD family)